jgi:hypothetical protein
VQDTLLGLETHKEVVGLVLHPEQVGIEADLGNHEWVAGMVIELLQVGLEIRREAENQVNDLAEVALQEMADQSSLWLRLALPLLELAGSHVMLEVVRRELNSMVLDCCYQPVVIGVYFWEADQDYMGFE